MGTVPEASGGEQAPIVAAEAAPVAGSAAPATPTSGLLVVDKPRGVTSHDIVAAARGALHMKRWGTPAPSTRWPPACWSSDSATPRGC